MPKLVIYHHGECSKCKETTALLDGKGYEIEYRFYLLDPPAKEELQDVLARLGMRPSQLIRRSEPLFTEQYEGKQLAEDEWLQVLIDNPVLLQRPIVVNGDKAIIARPPESVLEII